MDTQDNTGDAGRKRPYRILSAEVWAAIRAEWEAGVNPATLSRRYGVGISSICHRRDRQRWSRAGAIARLTAPAPVEIDALAIAESALARSVEALAQGRATDAMALIKAGDAVGSFAEFVAKLRANAARRAGERRQADADPSQDDVPEAASADAA